jgi:small-conductance mechanosensitive channel
MPLAFQDAARTLPGWEAWLNRTMATVQDGLGDAVENSAGFLADFGTVLVAVIGFAVILIIVTWVGRRVRAWISPRLKPRWQRQPNMVLLIDKILQVSFLVLGMLFGLRMLGVASTSIVTAVGIVIAALSIALQDVIKNLVAGLYLLGEQPFVPGDHLAVATRTGVHHGRVENVGMRVTQLRNRQQELLLVPNYLLFAEVVTNKTAREPYSLYVRMQRIDDAPGSVERKIQDMVLQDLGEAHSPPTVDLMGTGPDGIAADIRIWFPRDHRIRRNLIVALHAHYPEATLDVLAD